jgi:type II secretory pathway component GspD/PulD (secretin)
LSAIIELLKTTTDAKTLASPNIHAVSGQESYIQIGDQLGYRVTTTTQTSSLESVQMLDVGIVLRVTPRITRDGRVLMRIRPEVSTGQVVDGLPNKKTTEVETDVLLSSGQGMVIGGLIQEVDNNVQSKIPLLGEIPYVGVLFSRRQVTKSRQEIIVTLQPHVLPYEPIVQARLDHDFMRTAEPLTQGAICSYPRPYEPRIPDQFDHFEKHKHALLPDHWIEEANASMELTPLPPVDPLVKTPAARPLADEHVEEIPEILPLPTVSELDESTHQPAGP